MAGFKCPFCGEVMSLQLSTVSAVRFNFHEWNISQSSSSPCLEVTIFRCPNDDCKKETVIAAGTNGYINNSVVHIYPPAQYRHFPDYVPEAIRQDYVEACAILGRSPKAAATLARRCLQGMIHDFWNIHEKNLNAEVTQLRDRIPPSQWKAIDAVRRIGNIGAHMEHDVNRIIDVDQDEAQKLLKLIEHLIEKWYIDRHDAEVLYAELSNISQEKTAQRNP